MLPTGILLEFCIYVGVAMETLSRLSLQSYAEFFIPRVLLRKKEPRFVIAGRTRPYPACTISFPEQHSSGTGNLYIQSFLRRTEQSAPVEVVVLRRQGL